MSTDAAAPHSPPDRFAGTSSPANPRGRRLPLWGWIVLVVYVAAVAFIRSGDGLDRAIVNILTLVCTFLAGMSIFVWFCFFSGYGRRLRMGLLLGSFLTVATLAASLKIVSVSGEMIPAFRVRWAATPDRALASIRPVLKPSSDPSKKPAESKSAELSSTADDGKTLATGAPAAESPGIDLKTTTPDDFGQFLGPQRSCWIPGPGLCRTGWRIRRRSYGGNRLAPAGRPSAW